MPGPVPSGTVRLQIDYSLLNGAEIAVNTLHFHLTGVTWAEGWVSAQALTDAIAGKLVTAWSTIGAAVTNKAKVKDIKVYSLSETTGDAVDEAVHSFTTDELTTGTSSSTLLPPTIAPVIQLWGYDPAGFATHRRARRGRLFMPGCTTTVMNTDTGSPDLSNVGALAGGWKQFLHDCSTISVAGSTLTPVVLSKKYQLLSPIEAVSVSNHFGHQVRRADALAYNHSSPLSLAS